MCERKRNKDEENELEQEGGERERETSDREQCPFHVVDTVALP